MSHRPAGPLSFRSRSRGPSSPRAVSSPSGGVSASFATDLARRIEEEVERRVGEALARPHTKHLGGRVAELEEELGVKVDEAARWQEVRRFE